MPVIALLEMGTFNPKMTLFHLHLWTFQLETQLHLLKANECTIILAVYFLLNGQISMVAEAILKFHAKLSFNTLVKIPLIRGMNSLRLEIGTCYPS